jgi:outer membrane lipoprotein-sorting protein
VLVAFLLSASALSLTTSSLPHDPPPRDGVALVRQMRERYAASWYRTLTFVQKTTLPNGKVETWHEALSAPGRLRIDIAPLDSMNTLIFRNDSLYEFNGGTLTASRGLVHPLMVLGFDVYVQPDSVTVGQLRSLGYDLSRLHETTWQGRPTYVVGAAPGDSTTRQFWIDKERLYFVRSLEPSPQSPTVTMETRFEQYRRMGGGWLEHEVVFLANGEVRMREEYRDTRIDVPLSDELFRTDRWGPPTWIR